MIGARLRISDVETCNTSVFCGFIVCWNKLYRQIYNSLEVLSIFVLGKGSPVISRKILQKWLLWAKPESSAILSIV